MLVEEGPTIATEGAELGAAGGFGRRLRALEPLVGTVITVPSVALAELTAGPVDPVWIDLEHGALGVADVQPLAIGSRAARAAALVRLRGPDDPALRRELANRTTEPVDAHVGV